VQKLPPLASRRAILFFLLLTLVSGLAMLPAINQLADNGTSIFKIEFAGSASEAARIHEMLSDDSRQALYVQLFVDVAFLIGYGFLTAAICLWCSERAAAAGRMREAGWAARVAVLGPIAAACDMAQNISLAIINGGHTGQPWPRISQVGGYLIFGSIGIAAICAILALIASRLQPR
jgi:hypothetical protein